MISAFERVIVAVRVSAYHCVAFAPSNIVYSDRLVVFGLQTGGAFAALACSLHDVWAHRPGVTKHDTRNTYFPEQAFDTFPMPLMSTDFDNVGDQYSGFRRRVMEERRESLTEIYNRFHSPHEVSHDIATLRALHVEMDYAVAAAYRWTDLDLGHDFHQTKQGVRYTISEAARRTVLDRLLALNHERYAQEEAAAGASSKPARKPKARKHAPDQKDLF
jgi:hypothetical protein